jgi:hypothetical protein
LRSLSVQLDGGPLMPMPFSRDPADGTLYHGQLRVAPNPTAVWDPSFVHTLRVVATDTAGRTGEDRRQFRSADNRGNLVFWFDATDVYSSAPINGALVDRLGDRRDPLYDPTSVNTSVVVVSTTPHAQGRSEAVTLDGQRALRFRNGLQSFMTRHDLAGRQYTIFAVVRRESARAENYPIVQPGTGCNVGGCDANSALHIGWLNERTIRFSQYYNDLDLTVPALNPTPARSLLVARAGASTKYVSLDEPGFSKSAEKRDSALLRPGGGIGLGGFLRLDPLRGRRPADYPFEDVPAAPGFRFEGNIFEVIVFNEALSDGLMDRVKSYLKAKYRI